MASLSGELTAAIGKGLKKSANTLIKGKELDLLNDSLDDLVKKGEIDNAQKIRIITEMRQVASTNARKGLSDLEGIVLQYAKILRRNTDDVSKVIKKS